MKGKTKGKELETKRRKENNLEDLFSFLLSFFKSVFNSQLIEISERRKQKKINE